MKAAKPDGDVTLGVSIAGEDVDVAQDDPGLAGAGSIQVISSDGVSAAVPPPGPGPATRLRKIRSGDFYATDHLGTVRAVYHGVVETVPCGPDIPPCISNVYVLLQSTHDYEPYGVELFPTDPTGNTHQFTGHERDKNTTGNDWMKWRFYQDQTGRFLKPDNIAGSIANPQSWNRYAYVQGNPVSLSDPSGHFPALPGRGFPIYDESVMDAGLARIAASPEEAYDQMVATGMDPKAAAIFANVTVTIWVGMTTPFGTTWSKKPAGTGSTFMGGFWYDLDGMTEAAPDKSSPKWFDWGAKTAKEMQARQNQVLQSVLRVAGYFAAFDIKEPIAFTTWPITYVNTYNTGAFGDTYKTKPYATRIFANVWSLIAHPRFPLEIPGPGGRQAKFSNFELALDQLVIHEYLHHVHPTWKHERVYERAAEIFKTIFGFDPWR